DLPPESIAVIPHPAGNTPLLERSSDIWRNGTIFYSGRLERRKGVIEWIEAAVSVALEYPDLQFDFVGANILEKDKLSSQRLLDSLIPEALRRRFRFHGSQPHALRTQFLARARIAVIPSRWENFPYTCIEAMSSGLPVIASREGGMAEMVTEGRSGWLSPEPTADALKATLVRALGTPATLLADMGRSAADDIRRICDNERILENHLRFRAEVAIRGAKRSLHLPCGRSGSARSSDKADQGALTKRLCGEGIAVVVIALNGGGLVRQSLQSLEEQTLKPVAIAVVCSENARGATEWVPYSQRHACFVITAAKRDGGVAKNSGIDAVLGAGISPRGFVFLTAGDTLKPGFVAACDTILRQFPNVGLVSCWIEHGARRQLFTGLLPAFPYQWLFNDVVPIAAIRTEALLEYGKFDTGFSHGFENWDLCNGIMVAGWTAITIPEVLGHWATGRGPRGFLLKTPSYWTMRREFLEKFSEAFSKDARDLLLLTESHITHSVWGDVVALRKKLALARVLLTNPLRAAAGVTKRLKYKLDRRRILQLWKLI
ncbi:MAG TPA: glycosyltransferase, partial [Candidatus Eisenbacteria bacterium]|nr:glycosyltransferase [Candidatus Eisenbacteria bacterium]